MTKCKITSVNCRGLHDPMKRKDVLNYLRSHKSSIYCLQDTHCTELDKNSVYAQWGNEMLISQGKSDARGTLTLFNNTNEINILKVFSNNEGNFIISNIMKYSITLVNLYGPKRDNPNSYSELSDKINDFFDTDFIIMCGDWNVVQDYQLDCFNYLRENNPKNKIEIEKIKSKFNLVDPWRIKNPNVRKYTWSRKNPVKQARLDFFLVSEELLSIIDNVHILPGYRTDHSIIELDITINDFKKGKGFWRFNNSLLKNKDFVTNVKKIIKETDNEYRINESTLEIPDNLFLDVLLMKIRDMAIQMSSKLTRERREHKVKISNNLKFLHDMYSDNHLPLYLDMINDLERDLEEIRKYELKGLLLRSHCKWIEDGEKPTKYFCALEKRNYVNKNISKLDIEGKHINKQEEILQEVKKFYKQLYANKDQDLDDVNLKDLLQKVEVPKINNKIKEILDAEITKQEVLQALKNFKNDKTPGTDGFTAEFLKNFWMDIDSYILKSFNYSYEMGQLSYNQKLGIISILPKGNKPMESLKKNWRPITLLNITYKLLSSVLANRMKPTLTKIIHENQKGFLAGRYIGENSRLLYDIMHYCKEYNNPGLILLVDFEKAFDSISWKFIYKVLHFF